jgi:hypothetical protein
MGTLSEELANIDFADFISALFDGGWFEYVFPFMLVYAIVLTILNNVPMFEEKKAVRVIISLVMSLFAIAFPINGDFASCGVNDTIYHSYGCESLGSLMMALFPGVTAFAVGILALYIVAAMLGVDLMDFFKDKDKNNYLKWVLGGLGALVVIYYYARGFGWGGFDDHGGALDWLIGPAGLLRDPVLYILIIVGILFWWITKEDDNFTPQEKYDRWLRKNPNATEEQMEKAKKRYNVA